MAGTGVLHIILHVIGSTRTSGVCFRVYLAQKTAKSGYFLTKLTFGALNTPPEVWVEHKTCSTICGTPVPAILNHKNSTKSAGGAREGQNMAYLGHINGPCVPMHFQGGRGYPQFRQAKFHEKAGILGTKTLFCLFIHFKPFAIYYMAFFVHF